MKNSKLGYSSDFSQYDIIDDKAKAGKRYAMGDFNSYGSDCSYGDENLCGFGSDDELGGDIEEGMGFRLSMPKFSSKTVSKAVAKVKAAVSSPSVSIDPNKALALLKKPAAAIEAPVVNSNAPATVDNGSILVATPNIAQKSSSSFAHPILQVNKKVSGQMSGFLDDLMAKARQATTAAYQANIPKLQQAAIAQGTNAAGSLLNKYVNTNPAAQAAIASTVATATGAAQASAVEKIKAMFEENKKYIYIAGGLGLVAVIYLKMKSAKKLA